MTEDPGPFKFKVPTTNMFMKDNSPCVYFVQEGDAGPVKIGMTMCQSLENRLVALQIGNPRPLRFVGLVCIDRSRKGAYFEEGRLHKHFRDLHVRGEWFEMCESLRSLIAQYSYEKYGGELREVLRSVLLSMKAA